MRVFKLFIFFSFLAWCGFLLTAKAQTEKNTYKFQFHLFLTDAKVLTLDPAYPKPYDIVISPGSAQTGLGYGEFFSVKGVRLGDFGFPLVSGANTVNAPFYPNAAKVIIYGTQASTAPLTLDLSSTEICNENSICEQGIGENTTTCPSDCAPATLTASSSKPSQTNSTGINSVVWLSILVFFFLATLGFGLFLFIHHRTNAN